MNLSLEGLSLTWVQVLRSEGICIAFAESFCGKKETVAEIDKADIEKDRKWDSLFCGEKMLLPKCRICQSDPRSQHAPCWTRAGKDKRP